MDFKDFLLWERASRDTLDVKRVYIDMAAGDLIAGIMLSELVYWYLPSKENGKSKLRVRRNGHEWIAVRRVEWWDRVRITPRQADTALNKLIKMKLVFKARFRFDGEVTVHVRLNTELFLLALGVLLESPPSNPYRVGNGIVENGEIGVTESVKSLSPKTTNPITETTTETTTTLRANARAAETPSPLKTEKQPRQRDELFDAVAQYVFKDANAEGGRVAKISNWLKGNTASFGKRADLNVGTIDAPATPQQVKAFADHWTETYPTANLPLDPVKFVEHWRAWRQTNPKPARVIAFVSADDAPIPLPKPSASASMYARTPRS